MPVKPQSAEVWVCGFDGLFYCLRGFKAPLTETDLEASLKMTLFPDWSGSNSGELCENLAMLSTTLFPSHRVEYPPLHSIGLAAIHPFISLSNRLKRRFIKSDRVHLVPQQGKAQMACFAIISIIPTRFHLFS